MIIQAINDYYNLLLNDPDIKGLPKPGYSVAKVNFVMTISKEGELLDLAPLGDDNKDWIEVLVPEQKKRAGRNPPPYFMCENCKFVFGWDFNKKGNKMKEGYFISFKELHEKILPGVDNAESKALLNFLEKWNPEDCLSNSVIKEKLELLEKSQSGNIIFQLDCESGYLHQNLDIIEAWEKYLSEKEDNHKGQCLVTGENVTIAKIHPAIKGVRGAQSAGGAIVSVNAKAFESYQKEQGYVSPVGQSVAFGYTTVLNYMLNNNKNSLQIGDATTVFWAEDTDGKCENLLMELFAPEKKEKDKVVNDPATISFIKDSLYRLKNGKPIREKSNVNFYILGLSPNNARISVRFWYRDNFGNLVQRVWQHHQDMKIVNMRYDIVPISRIIYETIPRNARNAEAAPLLSGALMKSVFTGTAYPHGLFYAIVNRIRSDGDINDIRAGIIKAFLKRIAKLQKDEFKGGMITVGLNEENMNVAYRLGRLFAVLEKTQKDAADVNLNSTIKDRYFGTASASPRVVFPVLIKLSQHHISKSNYGFSSDLKIQEIVQGIDEFPAHLNSEEQGLFILGYYHQREAFYQKKEVKKEGE